MMNKTKTTIKWILSIFFLLSAFVYFPNVVAFLVFILGLFLMPIKPIENFIQKHLKARWMRVLVAVVLFIVAMLFIPAEPETPDSLTSTLPTWGEAIQTTQISTIAAPTEETIAVTDETTDPAVTESLILPPIVTDPTVAITDATLTLPESSFEIHFIDVGQADAALVLCDGHAMLIDGGNAEDSSKLYTYLKKHNVSHLHYVIGSHAHEDHIGGIAGALNYASVGTAYCPVTTYTTKAFTNFVNAVEKHGTTVTVPSVGTTFSLGSASCKILAVNTDSEPNNSSIVLKVTYGNTSFLFTGDAEREVEQEILGQGVDISSTVLKVGHHGSDTSTSYLWLRQIMPKYAVISVGSDNSYGHPTEEVLSRLRDAEVKTYRTDLQGDIICVSDGTTVTFTTARNTNADTFGGIGNNSTQQPAISTEITEQTTIPTETEAPEQTTVPTETEAPEQTTVPTETEDPEQTEEAVQQGTHYVLNTNSMKFHYANCHSAKKIKPENRKDYYGTREELIAMGYDPCGNCDP